MVHPNNHPQDSDLVELDDNDRIFCFHSYPHPPNEYFANLVNAALYVVRRDSLAAWAAQREQVDSPLDFAKQAFPAFVAQGKRLYGYRTREYIKDAGTPERLKRVRDEFASGRRLRELEVFAAFLWETV